MSHLSHIAFAVMGALSGSVMLGAEQTMTPEDYAELQRQVPPQADESQWARVPWMLNLKDARDRAVREDKPIFLWRSGGGEVLGRT